MLQHSLYELIHHIITAAVVHFIQPAGLGVGFSDFILNNKASTAFFISMYLKHEMWL